MNYYKHHIGDYDADTAHLSMLEDGAYRRLMSLYYRRESPIPADVEQACRLVRATTKQDRAAVEAVLVEFFTLADDGWRHNRCDKEIAASKKKGEANRENGKGGGRPKMKPTDLGAENPNRTDAKPSGLSVGLDTRAGPTAISHKPEEIPPIPPRGGKTPAIGLKAWIVAVKAQGEAPIPEGDPVFAYAEDVGIPREFLALAWGEFKHRYSQPEAKRYRDWRAVFRKAVRGNWLKLWWLDAGSGVYALTTVGEQARRANARDAA